VSTSYESISLPVSVVVEPSTEVGALAVSLDFGDARAPEAPTFDGSGGTRQYLVSTARPETIVVSYRVKVNFQSSNWPVFEISGTTRLEPNGFRIVLRPSTWLRRHTAYMYIRKGNQIVPAGTGDPADHLTLTATYVGPGLSAPIRTATRITPEAPVTFTYPVPPDAVSGRATLSAVGMVGGQLVGGAVLEVQDAEESLYLLVEGQHVQLVGRNAVMPETDTLAERLRTAGARPVVSDDVPSAEDERGLSVEVEVFLIPQPTNVTCWAAALAMVVSARDQTSTTPETVASAAGMDTVTGYSWWDIRRAVSVWGLVEEGPRSAVPGEWARLLEEWGPIWIVEVGAPYHAVVLGAVDGDGTPEGTYVKIYNPWPPTVGAVEWKTFRDFDWDFGLGAGAGAAMVHANRW